MCDDSLFINTIDTNLFTIFIKKILTKKNG